MGLVLFYFNVLLAADRISNLGESKEMAFVVGVIKAVLATGGEVTGGRDFVAKFGGNFKLASEYKESDDVIDESEDKLANDDEDVMSDSELKEVEQEQKPLTNKDADKVK